ncbi:putative arylsulfatase [Hypoxylon sp. FL1284]|nr:putative arylsulfatase [Hypoxylon sp. FL1284]
MRIATLTALLQAAAAVSATTAPPADRDSTQQQQQQLLFGSGPGPGPLQKRRPNVVFVLTDDQDVHLSSLDYMPLVRKHLLDKGTNFKGHYATTAVCCPSRVTLWTGRHAHNTNVTDVSPPYGGYPKFISQGFNDNYFPVWLQEAGYNTYYTGKLFNAHTIQNYDSPAPGGLTGSDFLLDPYTYAYLNSTFQRNGEAPRSYEGQYGTDVLAAKAYGLLDEAVAAENPFFLVAAPVAPHANVVMNKDELDGGNDLDSVYFTEPVPADRHADLFPDEKVPRTLNFNPEDPSGANWIRKLPQQNSTNVEYNDHFYRQRLRALQAVDEMVEGLVERLEEHGVLDDTYIVYSSDNGELLHPTGSSHKVAIPATMMPGKSCGYEEDVNVPLIVRGPGVAAGHEADGVVTTHADLAPTFFDLLGIPARPDFDGAPIPVARAAFEEARNKGERREHAGIEYWGFAMGEGIYNRNPLEHNTYKAIRLSGPGYNLYYSVWCNNEHELYDMDADPGQLHNLLLSSAPNASSSEPALAAGQPAHKVAARLDALLLVLKTCAGAACQRPWRELHPDGAVRSLGDALAPRYDGYYEEEESRPRVAYEYCANGFLADAEGPTWQADGRPFGAGGARWEDWV